MSHLIVAMTRNGLIGDGNKLPWSGTKEGKEDMQYFKQTTQGHAVIMGYKTFMSIGKPLTDRINIIVTRTGQLVESDTVKVFSDIQQAIKYGLSIENELGIKCFIIGGSSIYLQYLELYRPTTYHITIIPGTYSGDSYFPIHLIETDSVTDLKPGVNVIKVDTIANERAYLDHFRLVLQDGVEKVDRTGVGTLSYFSPPDLSFSLRNHTIPFLTSKRLAWKTMAKELFWFISGSTDANLLTKQGCNIWKGNTSRQFLDGRGLTHYKEGDLGPGYGFQWRHCGADYTGMDSDYTGQGIDQLSELVTLLRQDPDSRRMIMTAWHPPSLDKMALPPCHILYQVYSYQKGGVRYLCAKMYQRSADSFLGVPFNIASYALLTHFIAQVTGMIADRLVLSFGDYHIYKNHIDQVKEQLSTKRQPRALPRILFTRDLYGEKLENISFDDFDIVGYYPHESIKATMAV